MAPRSSGVKGKARSSAREHDCWQHQGLDARDMMQALLRAGGLLLWRRTAAGLPCLFAMQCNSSWMLDGEHAGCWANGPDTACQVCWRASQPAAQERRRCCGPQHSLLRTKPYRARQRLPSTLPSTPTRRRDSGPSLHLTAAASPCFCFSYPCRVSRQHAVLALQAT